MAKQTIRITESELNKMIRNVIQEGIENGDIDEGLLDYIKGAGSAIKNKLGKAMGQAGDKLGSLANNAGQKMRQAGHAINKQFQDINNAGKKASMTGNDQKVANQLINWYNDGVFGNNRQAKANISGLINAMKAKYANQFGEESSLQKNW